MKKVSIFALCAAIVLVGFSSCLKDEGYEDGHYGLDVKEMKGVAFPQATVGVTLGLTASATPVTVEGPIITLEQDGNPSSDVVVTLQMNNALVTGAGLNILPVTAYSTNLTVTIPAGKKSVVVPITFPNSATLNPNLTYGIGFSIVSITEGYTIARNMSNVLFTVTVRNKYDGVYSVVSGKVTRYTAPGSPANDALSGSLAGNPDVRLITASPNTVTIPAPASPNPGTIYWANGQNSQVAGIDGVTITVNETTNAVTVSSAGNATLANWSGSTPGITYNRYDPATKTFYLAFRWNPTANVREYEIVLRYKGPR